MMTTEEIHKRPVLNALPDPADRPMADAAQLLSHCTPRSDPVGPEIMLRELRAAMAEFSPGGHFRTADIRLSAQMSILDSMFHIGVQNAVKAKQIMVTPGSRENDFCATYKDGALYLDKDPTLVALKVQNQCRHTIEGLKSGTIEAKRTRIAARRLKLQEKNKKS